MWGWFVDGEDGEGRELMLTFSLEIRSWFHFLFGILSMKCYFMDFWVGKEIRGKCGLRDRRRWSEGGLAFYDGNLEIYL